MAQRRRSDAGGIGVNSASPSAPQPPAGQDFASLSVTAPDGLRLNVRRYGGPQPTGLPVVCLPGIARTAADFHSLATALAADPGEPRTVLALDYRGRGRSEYDRHPENYTLPVECDDVVAVVTALEAAPAVFVGTSHGGLIVLMLAVMRPTLFAGAILNDIGPVIEPQGLMRLKRVVDKLPTVRSLAEGADILRRLFESHFTRLSPQEWAAFAARTWRPEGKLFVPDYDMKLARALQAANLEHPPTLWTHFDALARVPLMIVRGANSDMLSSATLDAMLTRRAELDVAVVPDQGHPPFLAEPKLIQRIAAFVASCDMAAPR